MRLLTIFISLFIFACNQAPDNNSESAEKETAVAESQESNENSTESTEILTSENEPELNQLNQEQTSNEYDDIDWAKFEASMTLDFSFVILISTKNYESALTRANEASEKLGYPIDLRGLHPHEESGLSLSKEDCANICGEGANIVDYPQYIPRIDYGESKYVSIEYSNGYDGFTPGYFIVIVASGEKGDPIIDEALDESRKYYEDAYAKTCGVYMGCGC